MAVYMAIVVAAAAGMGIYVYFYARRMMSFYGLDIKKRRYRLLAALLAVLVIFSCRNMWSVWPVIVLHILMFAIVLDLIALTVKKLVRRPLGKTGIICARLYGCGLLPFLCAGLLMAYGALNMTHAIKTEYSLTTDKAIGSYEIALITDTHYGTIQSTDVLKEKIAEINEQSPDLVVLSGDIVEEGTSREQMEEVFQVLGGIQNKYGIYYVYGNHDRQPYTQNRTYTDEELEQTITGNGITILEDSYVEVNGELVIAGRADAAWGNVSGRATTEEVLNGADREKYIILADHQPIAAEENDAQGVDLELSGHTHAGQIWPIGILSELTGVLNYGEYGEGNCTVIVSSGFTGWGYPIRTEEHCEYVMIHLNKK